MKPYTVIGIWADQSQPWMEFTMADNPREAVYVALVLTAYARFGDSDMDPKEMIEDTAADMSIVEVIEGHHPGILTNSDVLPGNDVIDWIPSKKKLPTYIGLNSLLDKIIDEKLKG